MNLDKEIDWLLREKYRGKLTEKAKVDIERLQNGEHAAYVIGFADFLGVRVDLSEKPLIPRPETEYWTGKAMKEMEGWDARLRVLDLFSGSGAIGLAVLKYLPQARVDFADIEPRYAKGIRKSARKNGLRRFRIITSDVFSKIRGEYDYILANPPYIPSSRELPESVAKNDPHNALFAGRDGLKYIRAVLKDAKKYLAPGGELWLEFDSPQKKEVGALARRHALDAEFFQDQYAKWRYAILKAK